MPGGGKLTIRADQTGHAEASDPSLPPGDYVRVKIIDTGVGMDAATRAKATEPFFTTKGPGTGAGLGLSVVHGLAAQSGGLLRIDSAPNRGTAIELWLPLFLTNDHHAIHHAVVGRDSEAPPAARGT
jgi:signal transduction histidine kinase